MSRFSSMQTVQDVNLRKYDAIIEYLNQDDGYLINNDVWNLCAEFFNKGKFSQEEKKKSNRINFSEILDEHLKNEMKYYIICGIREKRFSLNTAYKYRLPIKHLAGYLNSHVKRNSFNQLKISDEQFKLYLQNQDSYKGKDLPKNTLHMSLKNGMITFITDYYDERIETDKDIWNAKNIPGARVPASAKNAGKNKLSFDGLPEYYQKTVKKFMRNMVTRRSWSYCSELLIYIKYFFRTFYANGYSDGFLEVITRDDIERYLFWVNNEHKDKNATYRSKFVSYISKFLEYIQLAQYLTAPKKEVGLLIFGDDYPKRERFEDTAEKIKYIPEPIKQQLDAVIKEMETKKYIPVYILLRETGWRGTDILNLRYEDCLSYVWNSREERHNPYLCGEITKTGIPRLKIPLREEVAKMVKELIEEVKTRSTPENNPEGYLFNEFDGKHKGEPYNKSKLVREVQRLVEKEDIREVDGELYHFRLHSLRHTRAVEYAEQGMSIGIIKQILGHCSLQMTLHYAKVSENILYERWKETEKLNLFQVNDNNTIEEKNVSSVSGEELIHFEYIRQNLDAVRVPFGVCFKSVKINCKQQTNHCLTCASFCSTKDDIPAYEAEIKRVEELIEISVNNGRTEWVAKNTKYLEVLKQNLMRIYEKGIIHKNGKTREEE